MDLGSDDRRERAQPSTSEEKPRFCEGRVLSALTVIADRPPNHDLSVSVAMHATSFFSWVMWLFHVHVQYLRVLGAGGWTCGMGAGGARDQDKQSSSTGPVRSGAHGEGQGHLRTTGGCGSTPTCYGVECVARQPRRSL